MTDEVLVPQVDEDAETLTQALDDRILRASTCSDWPPEPPLPSELDAVLAEGTAPPRRHAAMFAAVRRPTTSSDLT